METVTMFNPATPTAPHASSNLQLRRQSPSLTPTILREPALPTTDPLLNRPSVIARQRNRKPAVLLPALLLAAIGFTAYLAVDTSITTFRSAWLRTDITRSGNGIQSAPRFDFQEQPIPGPFASFQNQWKSFLQQLPLLAASHGNENPSSP